MDLSKQLLMHKILHDAKIFITWNLQLDSNTY